MHVVRAKLCHAQLLSLPTGLTDSGSEWDGRGAAGRGRPDRALQRLLRLSQPAQQESLKAASRRCSGS